MHLIFVKTGVALRAENDERNVSLGYLCLLSQDDLFLFSWVPKTSLLDEQNLYNDIAKRTKNAITLMRAPSMSMSNGRIRSATLGSITIPISLISHLVIQSGPNFESICAVKMTIYIKSGTSSPDTRSPQKVTELDDEEQAINALGGSQFAPFWFVVLAFLSTRFEKEDINSQNFHSKYPTLKEVISEIRYWLNSIAFDLQQFSSIPSVYFITPLQPDAIASQLQRKPGSGLLNFATTVGNIGLGVVGSMVGQTKLEDATFEVLNTFSQLTRITKSTGSHVLENPLSRPILKLLPDTVRDFFISSDEAAKLLEEYEGAGAYLNIIASEVGLTQKRPLTKGKIIKKISDKSRDYQHLYALLPLGAQLLRKDQRYPISIEEWISFYDEQGQLKPSKAEIQDSIFARGVEADIRPDVWKYLLGVYQFQSTDSARVELSKKKTEEYRELEHNWQQILSDASKSSGEARNHSMGNGPGGDEREDGNVVEKLMERKYRVEKDVVRTDRNLPFFSGENAEASDTDEDNQIEFSAIPLSKNLEMLRNVLISYTVYNFDLGYVQGMNDLLAPILVVMQNDADSFWAFEFFMNTRMQFNFARDQSGMRSNLRKLGLLIRFMDPYLHSHFAVSDSSNLFICFRWMLVLFKREFEYSCIVSLWEAVWSCTFTKHFPIFIAFAILNEHRQNLLQSCNAFDETLKYINELSGKMNVQDILNRAEVLFRKLGEAVKLRLGIDVDSKLAVSSPENIAPFLPGNSGQAGGNTWLGPTEDLSEVCDEDVYELLSLLENE